jgi:hypothetical protein
MLSERRARRSVNVIRALAVLALASATAATAGTSSDTLKSSVPWWEKITVTMTGDGEPRSCKYESSLKASDPGACDVQSEAPAAGASSGASAASSGSKAELTRITFERQFLPGATRPGEANLNPGDTLLARQVLAINIDPAGAVKGCQVVAKSGDMLPDYGCKEAQAERFEANVKAAERQRQGFMTVLVYGHEEHVA